MKTFFTNNHILSKLYKSDHFYMLIGALLVLAAWGTLSFFLHEIVVASPANTFKAIVRMLQTPEFYNSFLVTLGRLMTGIFIGCLFGFVLGILSGLNSIIKNLLEPAVWTLMSIPPVIVTMLAMLWFGMGSMMVNFIASLLLSPFVYINTLKGMELVDTNIIEMARVYKYSFVMRLRYIYIPAISAPLFAGMIIVMGGGIRIVVLAELLGANDGIGFSVGMARSSLMIDELFAWAVVTLCIAAALEYGVLRPVQNRALRWNKDLSEM